MEELQVPTLRIAVEVHIGGDEHRQGMLFVAESPYHSDRPDAVLETLNDDREFLPFRTTEPGPGVILNKAHLRRVRMPSARVDDPGTCPSVTLVLDDGTSVAGELALDTRRAASRTVDKLNQAGRFIKLITDQGIEFVHLAHVVRVE